MRTLFVYLFISLLTFGFSVNDVYAKRFGGGRSFGVQRSHNSLYSQKAKPNAAKAALNASPWKGMLGGMLLGGLLASLFMGNGLAQGLMSWLILGVVLFLIMSFIRKRMNPAVQSTQHSNFNSINPFNKFNAPFATAGGTTNELASRDFDRENFLREAKKNFLRLQSAYDNKNLIDLESFTAPEVFAEIQMQLEERQDAANKTEVSELQAELLDVTKQAQTTIASVRFTGFIIENGEKADLDEIWHFRQFSPQGDWVVGGIQQDTFQA